MVGGTIVAFKSKREWINMRCAHMSSSTVFAVLFFHNVLSRGVEGGEGGDVAPSVETLQHVPSNQIRCCRQAIVATGLAQSRAFKGGVEKMEGTEGRNGSTNAIDHKRVRERD